MIVLRLNEGTSHELPCAFHGAACLDVEAGRGIDAVDGSQSFILTDLQQRHPALGNVFSTGACMAIRSTG